MAERFTVEQGRRGRILVVRSPWDDEFVNVIRDYDIKELELNYAKGFVGKNLDFLGRIPDLQVLLLTHRTITDISPIRHLHELRVLEVNTYCNTEIDFKNYPALEECVLEWRAKAKSLFSCKTLKKLFINGYSKKNTEDFSGLVKLEYLGLANAAVIDLQGLGGMGGLRFLGLYNLKKLVSLAGLETLSSLEQLEINGCRNIRSIEPVAALTGLRRFHLCDDGHIESLKPLGGLRELEEVLFYESTNILDGDLSPLIRLPKLKKVSFEDRAHYSLGRTKLQEIISSSPRQ